MYKIVIIVGEFATLGIVGTLGLSAHLAKADGIKLDRLFYDFEVPSIAPPES